jgi:uncharacterized protein YndB with AHSA1/START domain
METINSNETLNREIVITRVLNAPRELVFKAWTEPEHLVNWWGPNGFTNTFHEVNIKPGGVWRFTMHGPDGMDFPNLITFTEVVKPERLVYEHGSGEEGDPNKFNVVVTFEVLGDQTRLTMRSIFATAAARDYVIKEFGAIEGGNQTIDRLGAGVNKNVN